MSNLYNKYRKYILIPLFVVLATIGIVVVKNERKIVNTVRAFGDLAVTYLGVPLGDPIFEVTNILPGDTENRNIDVSNNGTVARMVAIKGVRTGPDGETDPKLESVLDFKITEGVTDLYGGTTGAKTLQDFFDDSEAEDGILLSILGAGGSTSYKLTATFPESAGNEYQGKSVIFDITFGTVAADHIVINEVFYDVDAAHGIDSWKDRGSPKNDKKKGNDDEWIELYNPTATDINVKNWTLEDNATGKNVKVIFHANKTIKAGGFMLISKDASMWKYWNENGEAVKLYSTDFLGDGLGDLGDHLVLKDAKGEEVDFVRWESDNFTTGNWTEDITDPSANIGASIERIVPGFDNDLSSDWFTDLSHVPSP